MSRKSASTVKRTVAELRAMQKRGEIKSDWKAAAKKLLPSGRAPDDAMEEIDWSTTELPTPRAKAHMTLRVDADVLDWFRAQGRGYQTRINAILRKYFEQHRGERGARPSRAVSYRAGLVVCTQRRIQAIMETLHLLRSRTNARRLLRSIKAANKNEVTEQVLIELRPARKRPQRTVKRKTTG